MTLRLAYCAPLPPARSGIADYSRDLLPALAQHVELTLFCADPAVVTPDLRARWPLYALADLPATRQTFDLALYQIGNSAHHAEIYALACRYPGLVTLHDLTLHHLLAAQQYARELAYSLGPATGQAIWLGQRPADPFAQPLTRRLLDSALGLLVHSRHAAASVAHTHPDLPLAVVPMPMPLPPAPVAADDRPFTFACIGQVTPNKRLDRALAAFAALHSDQPQTRFVIIGEAVDVDVPALVAALPPATQAAVVWYDYLTTFAAFSAAVARTDVVLVLRDPTAGETSAAALRALAQGKPVIVYDHAAYAELPDGVALRVPVGDAPALAQALIDAQARHAQMAPAARDYIAQQHAPTTAAAAIATFAAAQWARLGRRR